METLEGIRVLDFSRQLAGGAGTRVLANFGAEVLRVEWPEYPGLDFVRLIQPADGVEGLNRGGMFNGLNVDKRSFTLNMKRPEALAVVHELLKVSDVVYENMTPRVMRSWGLDYVSVRMIRPDIVYLSCSGFGQDGPRADYRSYGMPSAAHAGIAHLGGLPGRPPAGWGFAYADYSTAWANVVTTLMALHRREQTGRGVFIDVAQTQAATTTLGEFFLDYSVNGRKSRREGFPPGNRRIHPKVAPHNVYPCVGQDNWLAIAVYSDDEWVRLKQAMGDPEWARRAAYDNAEGRYVHDNEIDGHIAEWTKAQNRHSLAERLQARGVRAGPVQSSRDRLQWDPQLAHRGTFAVYDHPETGPRRHETVAARLSKAPYTKKWASPLLGQHNDYVYRELLALSDARMAELERKDIVRTMEAGPSAT